MIHPNGKNLALSQSDNQSTIHFSGLALDLYQLTMAAGYHAHQRFEQTSFELFVRRLPPQRSYLIAAGLQQAVEYLHSLHFTDAEVNYLRRLPVFAAVAPEFFDYLRNFRFTGTVRALPEGTVAFAGEPLLQITAPLIEAQLVETFLISTINFQTMIASKAARVVQAAQGRGVIEFGSRRAHGMDAARYAARAAFIGGCAGTSNVEAARMFDLPVYGTAAHSWTMSFENELEAFHALHTVFPEHTTLLLDTYDTLNAAHLATSFGKKLRGVRLDSGDIAALSKQVRAVLDEAAMHETKIMASGDLDEDKIHELLMNKAPIDLFGVGTALSVSVDAPALGGVYKLVEIRDDSGIRPVMKISRDKATWPCRKQVWRMTGADGKFAGDVIAAADETPDEASNEYVVCGGQPLLETVMQDGNVIAPVTNLHEAQQRARQQLAQLPEQFKTLMDAAAYPVSYSSSLEQRRRAILEQFETRHVEAQSK